MRQHTIKLFDKENSIHEISLICTLALIAFEDQSFKTFTLCYWAANTFGLFTFIRLSPIHWPYRLKCCICIHHYCMIWLFLPVNYVRYIVSLAMNYIIYWFLIAFLAMLLIANLIISKIQYILLSFYRFSKHKRWPWSKSSNGKLWFDGSNSRT